MFTKNNELNTWIQEVKTLTNPKDIHICTADSDEIEQLKNILISNKEMIQLNPQKFPNSYLYRSNPTDVARTENLTFICTHNKEEVGPNNNWMDSDEAHKKMNSIFKNSMKDRTMYVVPYVMGPISSSYSRCGVEITDSPYVALSMFIMTRAGKVALEKIERGAPFVKGLHSLSDLSVDRRFIMHFPEENLIQSVGTGYGGNALLGKKCHSLRIGSWQARKEGWLAEHMLILGVECPDKKIYYMAAAFPSGCGKTNLAMLKAPLSLKGYKVWTLGDDIAWLHLGEDGRLWAINPEAGLFGIVPGTSYKTNPNAMSSIQHDTIFTNVALNQNDNTPWWEGMDENNPTPTKDMNLLNWKGEIYTEGPAAHPNSRFTTSIKNCPSYSLEAENPNGVPISAIIFGGRRKELTPLVIQSKNWTQGVFWGATASSETTAAATTTLGVVRRDPMAMKPFCSYNFGLYWNHWLSFKDRSSNLPKIFHVNWFRKDCNGHFLWPGFSDNLRVLNWIIDVCNGTAKKVETPLGYLPTKDSLNLEGLNISDSTLTQLLSFDNSLWKKECEDILEYFKTFGKFTPDALIQECLNIKDQL